MDRLYITMIKDILDRITAENIDLGIISDKIGISTNSLIDYLALKKKDFSMYLLILDVVKKQDLYE